MLTDPLNKEDELQVKLIRDGYEIDVDVMTKRHPCARTFRVPDSCLSTTSLVGVKVVRNGRELGVKQLKCESTQHAMEQLIAACDQPLDFTCQVLNIVPTDKDKLDEIFVKAFQRNMPPDFHLLHGAGLTDVARGSVCMQKVVYMRRKFYLFYSRRTTRISNAVAYCCTAGTAAIVLDFARLPRGRYCLRIAEQ